MAIARNPMAKISPMKKTLAARPGMATKRTLPKAAAKMTATRKPAVKTMNMMTGGKMGKFMSRKLGK